MGMSDRYGPADETESIAMHLERKERRKGKTLLSSRTGLFRVFSAGSPVSLRAASFMQSIALAQPRRVWP
jgi:hypothetical protein